MARFVNSTGSLFAKRKTNEWLSGESIWLAPSSSGLQPFHKDYDTYREEFRAIGKDYALIPEYKSSDYIDSYFKDTGVNYFREGTKYSLTGSLMGLDTSAGIPTSRKPRF